MNKKIILYPKDFRYPTKEERKHLLVNNKQITAFGFKSKSLLKLIHENNKNLAVAHKDKLLSEWDRCLLNRLGRLEFTYEYLVTHYNRGIPPLNKMKLKKHYVNRLQFEYYSEIFYYFFFSVIDTIAHILNTYYSLNIPDNRVAFKTLKIEISNVQELINNFNTNSKEASDYRNSFTHRYPKNIPDGRTFYKETTEGKTLSGSTNSYSEADMLLKNIKKSYNELDKLISALKKDIKVKD